MEVRGHVHYKSKHGQQSVYVDDNVGDDNKMTCFHDDVKDDVDDVDVQLLVLDTTTTTTTRTRLRNDRGC